MVNSKQSSLRVRDGELLVSSFISSFEVKVIESDIEARAMAEGAREATGEKKTERPNQWLWPQRKNVVLVLGSGSIEVCDYLI